RQQRGRAGRRLARDLVLLRRERREELFPAAAVVADLAEVEHRDSGLLVERGGEVPLEDLGRTVGLPDGDLHRRKHLEQLRLDRVEAVLREQREDRARRAVVQGDRDVVLHGGRRGRVVGRPGRAARGRSRERRRRATRGEEQRED